MRHTLPRPTTASNFDGPQIFLGASTATTEGFYLLGPAGAVTNTLATAAGLATEKKFGRLPAALVGAATGAGLAAAAGALFGTHGAVVGATMGGVVGAYSTLRGNHASRYRDAGSFGLIAGSAFVSGPAKAGLGLAAVVAHRFENEKVRGLAAGAMGAAAGVAFATTGFSPLTPLVAGLACGGAAAFGATVGPRLAMLSRNLTEDLGGKMTKPGASDAPKSMLSRTVGILPMAAIRQGGMAFCLGQFNAPAVAVGFALDFGLSVYEVYLNKKQEERLALEAAQKALPAAELPNQPAA